MKRFSVPIDVNNIVINGNIVDEAKNFVTEKGKAVRFKIAHNEGRDKASFIDVAVLGNEKNPVEKKIKVDELKKGSNITVNGRLEVRTTKNEADGRYFTNVIIIAEEITKTTRKTVQISDDGKTVSFVEENENEVEDMPL